MFFESPTVYVTIIEIHALIQGCVLAYLMGMGSKGPIKKWLDRVVLSYFLYALAFVGFGRASHRESLVGISFERFDQIPDYWGITFAQWTSLLFGFVLVFLICCLHLWYTLLKRQRDWPMIFIYITSIIAITWWTIAPETAFVDVKSISKMMVIFYFPGYLYGLVLMWLGLRKFEQGPDRRRLQILFYAFLIPILFIFLNSFLGSQQIITAADSQLINIITGVIRSILIVGAILLYGLFKMDLNHASQDIFDKMNDPVLLLSNQSRILRANISAQKCLGISDRPIDSNTGVKLAVTSIIPNYQNDSELFETTIQSHHKPREYQCSRTTVERQGTTVGVVLLLRDITQEKELARMKTDFTSTVSHELRTPLTSVLGFAKIIQKRFHEIILKSYQPTIKKEIRAVKQITKNLDIIVSESKRLTTLINDVLDISKMEAGRIEWRFSRCNPKAIIEQAIQATDGLFGTKPVHLVRQIPEDLPEIVADSDRIVQVVINLISNAIKFTDEGSVTIAAEISGSKLCVHVQDTGMGISEADQKLVFEKYKQAGDVITDKPQGTGLGLPISKEIVEHHGGNIWVTSVVAQGTTFSFNLPLAEISKRLQTPISFTELLSQIKRLKYTPTNKQQKVLVIDDEESIRQVLRQSFEDAGHLVIEATDGEHGLASVKEHNPDVIILDVMMPRMNGFDVAATLKNDPHYMTTPIIMLTVVDDAQRIYGLGVERYITKPFEPNHIVTQAETIIKERGEPKVAILLGDIGEKVAQLESCLQSNGHKLMKASNVDELSQLVGQQSPDLLIISGTQYQDNAVLTVIRNTIGSTSVMTRTLIQS